MFSRNYKPSGTPAASSLECLKSTVLEERCGYDLKKYFPRSLLSLRQQRKDPKTSSSSATLFSPSSPCLWRQKGYSQFVARDKAEKQDERSLHQCVMLSEDSLHERKDGLGKSTANNVGHMPKLGASRKV